MTRMQLSTLTLLNFNYKFFISRPNDSLICCFLSLAFRVNLFSQDCPRSELLLLSLVTRRYNYVLLPECFTQFQVDLSSP